MFDEMRSIHQIDQLVKETASLRDIATQVQKAATRGIVRNSAKGMKKTPGTAPLETEPQDFTSSPTSSKGP